MNPTQTQQVHTSPSGSASTPAVEQPNSNHPMLTSAWFAEHQNLEPACMLLLEYAHHNHTRPGPPYNVAHERLDGTLYRRDATKDNHLDACSFCNQLADLHAAGEIDRDLFQDPEESVQSFTSAWIQIVCLQLGHDPEQLRRCYFYRLAHPVHYVLAAVALVTQDTSFDSVHRLALEVDADADELYGLLDEYHRMTALDEERNGNGSRASSVASQSSWVTANEGDDSDNESFVTAQEEFDE